MNTSTIQQKMQATLSKSGVPAKEIKVYGSQIMITAWSLDAAQKWTSLLQKLNPSKIRTGQGIDYARKRTKELTYAPRQSKSGVFGQLYEYRRT